MNTDRPPRTSSGHEDHNAPDDDDVDAPELEPPYPFAVMRQGCGATSLSTRGAAIHLLTLWEQATHAPMDQLLGEYLDGCDLIR